MKIYDSASQAKKAFKPIVPGRVGLYVCGNTVYDHCHIGHARAAMVFDMITRTFEALGYDVTLVRNITDIDDKIIQRALDNNETTDHLTQRMIDAMHDDERQLSIRPPHHEPRATQYLDPMIALIERLIDKGYAYAADNGDVYFHVKQFERYGELSKRSVDQLISGARIEVNADKKDPLDFALWKSAKPGEPTWPSPWGDGRPGWHIECSAMAQALLGETMDIHGGGMDLKFPHHENEKAQSEAAHACTFAHYWMHVGLLTINDEKMSKSLGNSVTIPAFLKQYPAEVLRHFMLGSHYRSPVNYCETAISNSHAALQRLYTAIRDLPEAKAPQEHPLKTAFYEAMQDDFHTPHAFSVLFDMARDINCLREKDQWQEAAALAALMRECGAVLGIVQQDANAFLQQGTLSHDVAQIEGLIQARNDARANKDWAKADELRHELDAMGLVLDDTASGTKWRLR